MKGEHTSYTEEQAINITIEHGYNGSELETSTWKQRGCLKPDRTLEGLISKLKTIYNYVKITGTGKKRKYILDDKKDQLTKRELNYKGTQPTPEDEIMKEFIFNQLLSYKNDFTKSYKGWAKVIGFINPDSLSIEEMTKAIRNLHYGFPTVYNPMEVVSIFINTLNTRNKSIIENSFQRLEKENRIKVNEVYNIKYIDDNKYKTISQLEYNKFIQYINEYLESRGVTYYAYSQAVTALHKTKNMRLIISEANECLADHFGIEYFFKSFSITVTDRTIKKQVTSDQFQEAYNNRLIKLTEDRQAKESYNNTVQFWKKFYLHNTLALLDYIHVAGIKNKLQEQNDLYLAKMDELDIDMTIHNLERHTFGSN